MTSIAAMPCQRVRLFVVWVAEEGSERPFNLGAVRSGRSVSWPQLRGSSKSFRFAVIKVSRQQLRGGNYCGSPTAREKEREVTSTAVFWKFREN
ncbi:hypothetical protein TNCV_3459231 [Trichonephila clavipes]|nr:hypothetical protein TNCV_3459231 [Trichonephila clavipes]